MKLTIEQLSNSKNIAKLLAKEKLYEISREVLDGYRIDEDSRESWRSNIAEATDLAMQVMDEKSFPWEGCSNIKYPLIAEAAIDYASRTGPEILRDDRIVKGKVTGLDPDSSKFRRSNRVCEFMSYDLMCKSPDWADGMDKLIQILPILGTVFKKTYYNEIERRICSDLCLPHNIVVNFGAQSLDAARRVTHILQFHKNDIISRQRGGIFLINDADDKPIDIDSLSPGVSTDGNVVAYDDVDPELQFLEQHCYIDLDEDGYREPYIVTLHKDSGIVFRIKARFRSVEYNNTGKVIRIIPIQYFTDYHFIRSFNGGYYSIGFGVLLLPLNKSINTVFNMLIDSGTLNTVQGGIIGSGIRLKNGELKFRMGRWQNVALAAGEDIAKNIFPWPTKEPSQTLFQLLGLLIQIGKEFTASTDIMNGSQPAQNVASNTVSQLIEQGSKTHTNINKRVYRSATSEFQKIYYLNATYLQDEIYKRVLDDPEADVKKDFELDTLDIYPVADPTLSTESQRMLKAMTVQQFQTVDRRQAELYAVETMQLDKATIEKLFPDQANQPPSPEMVKMQTEIQKIQAEIVNISAQATLKSQEIQIMMRKSVQDIKFSNAQIEYYAALVFQIQQNAQHNLRKDMITNEKMQNQEGLKQVMAQHKMQIDNHGEALKEVELAHEIVASKEDKKVKEPKNDK